jgi:hypothetical protein
MDPFLRFIACTLLFFLGSTFDFSHERCNGEAARQVLYDRPYVTVPEFTGAAYLVTVDETKPGLLYLI